MLGKIGSAFITGVQGLGAIVFFLAAAAFMAFIAGSLLEVLTRNFFPRWHWPASNWMIVCFTAFLVVYGLALVAPVLVETLGIGLKGAFWGALASGAVAWFYRLPWQSVATWGGVGFFLVSVFWALLQRRPAPPVPLPDIYGIGVDDPEKRMREGGYL